MNLGSESVVLSESREFVPQFGGQQDKESRTRLEYDHRNTNYNSSLSSQNLLTQYLRFLILMHKSVLLNSLYVCVCVDYNNIEPI